MGEYEERKYKVSEYDQEIPQSQTADQPTRPLGRATKHQMSRDIYGEVCALFYTDLTRSGNISLLDYVHGYC